ncbi:ankyrin repeat domain-containing protein 26-like [Molossus molossus]|uniref:ankyrin repeat domain-containing protein 26-like n=1 Tax=Molossus molossus TaxID=27622 RepID=UPI001745D324|nr:ankyrin repeat domain-containing protein 26-like [Molossus molossus]
MKKIFTRWRRQESWSSGSSTSTGRSRVGDRGPGYHIRGKDLKEIHKAASVGNAVKVRQILLLQINALNDRDKMNRTALHLACANGHPEVVTLLADQKKCLLDLCDRQNRTALFKAVQCQQEECAAVLLARGAHPNLVDIDGNTALHYAVLGQNAAIVAKLLSYGANMEARNKDGFTSLSLAKKQNKEQMVELLIKSNAKVDLMDRPTTQRENSKDQVISQTYCQTEKTSENQRMQIRLPRLHLEKMSPESEMNRECDSDDMSTYSGYPSVQKYEKMWIKQSKLEQRKNLQLMPNELKQKFGEICKKYKVAACPEEEPLRDKSKEGPSLRQIPSNLTNNILDCEEKDAFGMSVSAVFQTSPEREEPTLENISPSHSYCGSSTDAPCSFSKLCSREKILLSENKHKSDTEQVFNKSEERFYNDAENKVRNPAVTFEMKEYQGFGMQMTKNMNPNTTNWKLGIRHTPQSRVLKSPFDLWLPHCNHIKNTVQIKKHAISAVTNTYKETKPNADLFQKPLFIDNCSASNCKSMKYGIEDMSSSPPYSDRTPNMYANKKLQQDIQRFQNEIDMFKLELLALKKEQLQLQKQVEEENEKQKISKMKVTKDINKVAGDDSNGLIKQRDCKQADDQQFPIMKKGDSDRSLKEISYEEYKVKEKINSMDDLDDLIHSIETVSEPCQSPHSKCENFTLLIKQPCKHFKDSNILFQIQDAVLVSERAKECGKYQCELHTQKVKTVENGASGLHKKSSETREIESLLKHQKVELEQELWNLRFALKEEKEKRQKADLLHEKSREQLMKTEEQYAKETEMNRDLESTVRTLEMELKKVRQNLSQRKVQHNYFIEGFGMTN